MRLLRQLRYHLSQWPRRQTCKDCWRTDGLDFHVGTSTWNAVVAPPDADLSHYQREGWGGVFCLECFDRRAEARGVDYSGDLAIMGRRAWMADGQAMRRIRAA